MKQFLLLFTCIVTFGIANAQGLIETEADITDITVYTAAAEIHYEKAVDLKKGKNTIVFTGLTTAIVPNTVNVSSKSEV